MHQLLIFKSFQGLFDKDVPHWLAKGPQKSPEAGFSVEKKNVSFLFLSFFGSSKLLGKVFRTMTITKGLWGKTMDQKFEIGTPLLMKNFFCPLFRLLNFLCASFFFYLLGWPFLLLIIIGYQN